MKELINIQQELNVPKEKVNAIGGYSFRSCEDIVKAVKPLLHKHKCVLTMSDDVVFIGDRFYVKSTSTLTNSAGEYISTSASAREPDRQDMKNESQITGSASSYARKYSLCGLFAIDDGVDADSQGQEQEVIKPSVKPKPRTKRQSTGKLPKLQ